LPLTILRVSLIGLTPLVLLGCGHPSKTTAPRLGYLEIPPGQRSTIAIEEVQARIESVSLQSVSHGSLAGLNLTNLRNPRRPADTLELTVPANGAPGPARTARGEAGGGAAQ
jgi:hypothetical protein